MICSTYLETVLKPLIHPIHTLHALQTAAENPEVLNKAISDDREDFIIQWEGLARGLQRDAVGPALFRRTTRTIAS